MTEAKFSAQLIETLSYLSKNMTTKPPIALPKYTSMGDEIKTLDELSAAMGVNRKVAAVYAVQGNNDALLDEAAEFLNSESKVMRSAQEVSKLGVRGHAFRRKNGSYSYPISTVADLKNAIQAFGRAAPEDRERLKAFISKRARQLKRPDLIPENWQSKTDDMSDLELKKPVSAMDTSPLDRSPKKNWVEVSGQLPPYVRAIAHALIRDHGFTVSRAIATALSRIKRWIADPNTTAETKAKATKALAQWEALRAKNKGKQAAKKG